jgi:hypothetical protein
MAEPRQHRAEPHPRGFGVLLRPEQFEERLPWVRAAQVVGKEGEQRPDLARLEVGNDPAVMLRA